MNQEDYTPYRLEERQPGMLKLQLKKRHRVLRFATFRVLPWFLLLCLALTHESLSKEMPAWFYGTWLLLIAGLSVYLLLYRYAFELVLEKGRITRKLDFFYVTCSETETLLAEDSISVKKEISGRSTHWVFYLTQEGRRHRILYIPIFIGENLRARNNFARAFEQICGVKVSLPDTK